MRSGTAPSKSCSSPMTRKENLSIWSSAEAKFKFRRKTTRTVLIRNKTLDRWLPKVSASAGNLIRVVPAACARSHPAVRIRDRGQAPRPRNVANRRISSGSSWRAIRRSSKASTRYTNLAPSGSDTSRCSTD